MAASPNPNAYPASFAMIVEHFREPDAGEIVHRCERITAAERLRFRFYNYKAALNASPSHAEEARVAAGIIIKVKKHPEGEGEGADLVFSLRDNEDWALDLERAVLKAKGGLSTVPPPAGGNAKPTPAGTHDGLIDAFMRKGSE